MGKKPDEIKIDGIVIKDHKTVSFTTAFVIALICFSAGVLAYRYLFMILPAKPGCVNIFVKNIARQPLPNVKVDVYLAVVINETGEKVAEGMTGPGGRLKLCDVFTPNTYYLVIVWDKDGNQIWIGEFSTNERNTADVPVIVMKKST